MTAIGLGGSDQHLVGAGADQFSAHEGEAVSDLRIVNRRYEQLFESCEQAVGTDAGRVKRVGSQVDGDGGVLWVRGVH